MAGASPILAHAERYPTIQHHPELVADLVANEVLIQLNASSLLRSGSGRRRKTAEYLLRSRLAHLVASDAHDATVRPPLLTPALARAAELVGDDYVAWMAQTAADVVAGQPVIMPRPELDDGRERAWSRWWRRATGR
jgi:protein-tyrosine phosphatase